MFFFFDATKCEYILRKKEEKVTILQVAYYDYGKISVYITVLIEIIVTFADEMNPKE